MLDSLFGPKCPRCGERNGQNAETCQKCGISLQLDRPVILRDNRWEAAPDELAVFFYTRDLKGLFSRSVNVPAGMHAWVLQDSRCVAVREGEHTVANLFDQLNNLFSANHGEVLIARRNGMAVRFVFDDIPCGDLLALTVECSLVFKIDESNGLAAFHQTFMGRPGVITARHLEELLRNSVRQVLLETLAPHGIEALQTRPGLRAELEHALRSLEPRLRGHGLLLDGVEAISVRHDAYDAQKQLRGQLWIEYEQEKAQQEHKQRLADLYTAEQMERYKAAEAALRQRIKEGELAADESMFAEVLRHKELDRLRLIKDAETRERAIELGAGEEIADLEHQFAGKANQRADDKVHWEHLRNLARVEYETELKLQELQRDEKLALERQRFEATLERQRIESRIAQAQREEDAAAKARQLAAQADALLRVTLRENEITEAEHALKADAVAIRRESARLAAEREERQAAADEANANMAALMALDLASQQNAIQVAKEKQALEEEKADKALERESRRRQEERADKREEREHEISKLQVLGSLPNPALVLQADTPEKVEALVKMSLVTELSSGRISAEQIQAVARALAPQQGAEQRVEGAPLFAAASSQEQAGSGNGAISRDFVDSLLDRFERLNSEAQSNMKEVSIAHATGANGGRQPTSQNAQGAQAQMSAGFASAARVCPSCKAMNASSARYCEACQTSLA